MAKTSAGVCVLDGFIATVWMKMMAADHHTFLVLTKRPRRMYDFIAALKLHPTRTPPHIHLGVTVENQRRADERIPILLQTPAAVRFVVKEAGWLFRPPRERRTPTAADKN
jgi:protein gp37